MSDSIITIIFPNGPLLLYADDVVLFDVGVGTVTVDVVGARRGAAVVPFVVVIGDGTLSTGAKDGDVVVPVGTSEAELVVGVTAGVTAGVGAGETIGAVTAVGVETVPFNPAVKVQVLGQFLIEIHSHGKGKVMNSSPT
jgi:hypothetical protein